MSKKQSPISLDSLESSMLSRGDSPSASLGARDLSDSVSNPEIGLLAAARVGDKWGFINSNGDFVIPPQFDEVRGFSEGLSSVRVKQKWGYVDCAGDARIPWRYDDAKPFREGVAVARYLGKAGLLNKEERFIDLSQFEVIRPLVQGRGRVSIGKNMGFVDAAGAIVLDPRPANFDDFSGGFARFSQWVPTAACIQYGFIDHQGREVVPPILADAGAFVDGLACATRRIISLDDMHWGCINGDGDFVIPERFHQVWSLGRFDCGVLAVQVNRRWGYVDRRGNYLIQPRFLNWGNFREGFAAVKDNCGLYGFIDFDGSFIIPPKFEEARAFSEGLAAVKIDGKWGYISSQGNIEIPCQFEDALEFLDGIAKVDLVTPQNDTDFGRGFVTRAGKVIGRDNWIRRRFQGGFVGVEKSGKYGFMNRHGELVIPYQFDGIRRAHYSWLSV